MCIVTYLCSAVHASQNVGVLYTVEFGATNQDLRDLGHMCVFDSVNFTQLKPMSCISVGRAVILFLGHFWTAESLRDRHHSAEMTVNH